MSRKTEDAAQRSGDCLFELSLKKGSVIIFFGEPRLVYSLNEQCQQADLWQRYGHKVLRYSNSSIATKPFIVLFVCSSWSSWKKNWWKNWIDRKTTQNTEFIMIELKPKHLEFEISLLFFFANATLAWIKLDAMFRI